MKIAKPQGMQASGSDISIVSFPIVDPHTWFSWMYHHKRELFVKQFLGGDETGGVLEQFWIDVEDRNDPKLEGHAFHDIPNWKRRAVPIMAHGDAVPCIAVGKTSDQEL